MFDEYLGMVSPDIWTVIKAILLLIVAFIVAAIVKKIVHALLEKTPIRKVSENASEMISKLSQVVVFLLFVPGIFGLLGVDGAAAPISQFLTVIWIFVPKILAAVVIIWIGLLAADISGKMIERLIGTTGLDGKINGMISDEKRRFCFSKICGTMITVLLDVFFVVQAINVLQLEVLTMVGNAIIGFMPYILAAALIIAGCFVVDTLVTKILTKNNQIGLAYIAKIVIYVIGVFMILSELNIAPMIVNLAFLVMITGISIAVAIAFGVGGRDFAGRLLKRFEEKIFKS